MTKKVDHLLHTYRKRKDEYHIPLREGGWEKLEAELLPPFASGKTRIRWIAIAAAAILLCITLSVPFLLTDKQHPEAAQAPLYSPKQGKPVLKEKPLVSTEPPAVLAVAPKQVGNMHTDPLPVEVAEAADVIEAAEIIEVTEELIAEKETEKAAKNELIGPVAEQKNKRNTWTVPEKVKYKSGWSFGLSAGSNNTSASSTEVIPSVLEPGPPGGEDGDGGTIGLPGDVEEEEEEEGKGTKAASFLRSAPATSRYKYHHRLPLSVGISIRKNITEHFALESGLIYTYLHSDISEEGRSGYIGDQKLHYLGIPLRASWLFYNQGRFTAYLSGGALFEYRIAGSKQFEHIRYNLDISRFQLSLNAAAGVQMTLAKPLSLFIEPGIGYYFDHGGETETIRTEKPLMFNLQAGIRFTY